MRCRCECNWSLKRPKNSISVKSPPKFLFEKGNVDKPLLLQIQRVFAIKVGFGSRLYEGKVFAPPHIRCTQREPLINLAFYWCFKNKMEKDERRINYKKKKEKEKVLKECLTR